MVSLEFREVVVTNGPGAVAKVSNLRGVLVLVVIPCQGGVVLVFVRFLVFVVAEERVLLPVVGAIVGALGGGFGGGGFVIRFLEILFLGVVVVGLVELIVEVVVLVGPVLFVLRPLAQRHPEQHLGRLDRIE